jgi:high-affinity Fe2+/Pb2+ permease
MLQLEYKKWLLYGDWVMVVIGIVVFYFRKKGGFELIIEFRINNTNSQNRV